MNTIAFVGRVGRDAELRDVAGTQVLSFSVASDVGFGDKKTTNWFKCSAWGKQAGGLSSHIKKGTMLGVAGELSTREYKSKEGDTKTSLEVRVDRVTFAGGKKQEGSEEQELPAAPVKPVEVVQESMPF